MRNLKIIVTSVALSFLVAGPAKANVTDFDDLFPATLPGSTSSNLFGSLTPGTAFEDFYGFDLSSSGATAGAVVVSLAINPGLASQFEFNISLSEWNGSSYTELAQDTLSTSPFISLPLAGGSGGGDFGNSHYVLKVFGNAPDDVLAANYAGVLSVAAIPEPSSWAMLIGGIAALGFMVRRRTKDLAV